MQSVNLSSDRRKMLKLQCLTVRTRKEWAFWEQQKFEILFISSVSDTVSQTNNATLLRSAKTRQVFWLEFELHLITFILKFSSIDFNEPRRETCHRCSSEHVLSANTCTRRTCTEVQHSQVTDGFLCSGSLPLLINITYSSKSGIGHGGRCSISSEIRLHSL